MNTVRAARRPAGKICGCLSRMAVPLAFLFLLPGCGGSGEDEVSPTGKGTNTSFVAAQNPACARADLVSLQEASAVGSVVNVDIIVTDCDASLLLNGFNFEIPFDDTLVDFIGCNNGNLFPSAQLVPGTPACFANGGDLVGTIAMQLPASTRVPAAGQVTILRLTFSVRGRGVNSAADFAGKDSQGGTTLFFADQATQAPTFHVLGASGYSGGSFISN